MRGELAAVLDEIEADEAARVVILTGAGGHFCSGGDVKTMRAQRRPAGEGRARVESLSRMVLRLVDFPKPTIAMVDGYAVGAGSNLALCCDLIIASDRAKFGELFWKIGLVPDGGGTWVLSRVIGMARAKELIFTAEIIDAAEAGRIGLVNRVVPVAELETTTRALAEKIAAGPPAVLALAKHMVNRAATSDLAGALDLEAFSQASPSRPRTTRRGWPRSSRSGRRSSPGAESDASAPRALRAVRGRTGGGPLDGGPDDCPITFDEREVGHDHAVAPRDDAPDL